MILQVPLSTAPDQLLSITIKGVLYKLRVRLNFRMQIWTLDLLTSADEPLAYGVPMVPGVDLLASYGLELSGLIAVNINDTNAYLSTEDLPSSGGLFVEDE